MKISLDNPLKTLTPELSASLRERTESTLVKLLVSNRETQYFRESEPLSKFRVALSIARDPAASGDQDPPVDNFKKAVPLSSYADYLPFTSRLLESPCNVSDVMDLLSPGLPEFIAHSSGTSGGAIKYFPKYKHERHPLPNGDFSLPRNSTYCTVNILGPSKFLDIVGGEDGSNVVKSIPIGVISAKLVRAFLGTNIGDDAKFMGRHVPNDSNTSPYAAYLVISYPLCFLMHGLFAIADPSLVFINIIFSTMFYDFIQLMDENWDALVQAIEDGQLPELGDLGDAKPYLQANMKANADRAAELRSIDRKQEGWLKKIWPNLATLRTICSGPYSTIVPKIRFYLGPSVDIRSSIYGGTESQIAYAYGTQDLNLFKVRNEEYFEFLPIGRPESIEEIRQIWELVVDQPYEIVITTQDGLWRYQLGDVVEVAGFDPADGQPLIRYLERRLMDLRVAGEVVTERELRNAVHALEGTLGRVLEFTTAMDARKTSRAYGFFVELEGEPGPDEAAALEMLQSTLFEGNEAYKGYTEMKVIGPPTIRVLAPGTFRDYRGWKLEAISGGQIKVPAVVFDIDTIEWLSKRVVHEIEMQ